MVVVKVARPYTCYNLFFILERELLLQKRQGGRHATATSDASFIWGYEGLHIPSVPVRYQHLFLPANWYVPGKRKTETRKHSKMHGATSFTELPVVISRNWKCVDPVTRQFCNAVAGILKKRYTEIPAIFKESKSPRKKQTVATIKPAAPLPAKIRGTETTHDEKEALQQPTKVPRMETAHDEKEALQQALKIAQILIQMSHYE